jgi:hypothetical protein
MSDAIPVHCLNCNEPLDVYQPLEQRFCCDECFDEWCEMHDMAEGAP